MTLCSEEDGQYQKIEKQDQKEDESMTTNSPTHHNEILLYGGTWQKKNFSYKCSVNRGDRPILSKILPPSVPTYSCIPPNIIFMGECYMCGIKGHSQNYCPKKYCDICERYGHGDKVCPRGDINNNNNHRNKKRGCIEDRDPYPFYCEFEYRDRVRCNQNRGLKKKNDFGSGWKRQRMEIRSW